MKTDQMRVSDMTNLMATFPHLGVIEGGRNMNTDQMRVSDMTNLMAIFPVLGVIEGGRSLIGSMVVL